MLTQWFDPEPTFKGLAFAKELQKLGHSVEVLTGFPSYPGGKVYKGYRIKFFQREVIDGISVIRVPLYPSHDRSSLRRIISYLSFAFSAAVLGSILIKPADVMYVYHPPGSIGFPALIIRLFRRIPFVYDIQDLWPDSLAATGMIKNSTILKLTARWCSFVYKKASKIVVLSPGFKKKLCERGVPDEKIAVIYNWCYEQQIYRTDYNEKLSESLGLAGKFNVIFAGTMGKSQALDTVLLAAEYLSDRVPMINFVFVGGGIEESNLQQKAKTMDLSNVLFIPRCPMSEVKHILGLADVLLVHLKNDLLFEITIPSKIQAYLAVGKPMLVAIKGDAAELVERSGAGLICNPEEPQSIADGIEKMFNMTKADRELLGENGRRFYEENLSIAKGVRQFEKVFFAVVNSGQKS